MTRSLPVTDRTTIRRKPQRGTHERAAIDAILDEAFVCHVGFVTERGPFVIPTTHVRVEDRLYVHGSAASHMLRSLATGIEVSVCVTILDALVLSRTAFHHSVNYRSVVLFGTAMLVEDLAEKRTALGALVDRVVPERSAACRPPTDKELAATSVLALPIVEGSAKARTGPPLPDEGEDGALPYWAGIIPLATVRGAPVNAPDCTIPWPG